MKTRKPAPSHRVPAAARPDWRPIWAAMKTDIVHAAWKAYMTNPYSRIYLYYHRNDGPIWGSFHLVPDGMDPPPNTEPVTAEAIPADNEAGIRRWLEKYAGGLPMLGADPD